MTTGPAPVSGPLPSTQPRRLVIAIVASAGGIPALQAVLRALPPHLPAVVAIVLHRKARPKELLTGILQTASRLPVKVAESGEFMEQGRVYLAPADQHLVFQADGCVGLTEGIRVSHLLSSADPLFDSLARSAADKAIAVVLTGSGKNGAAGVRAVKDAGGTVVAQNRATSAFFQMPAAAIATGAVDYVLPLEEIGPLLSRLALER